MERPIAGTHFAGRRVLPAARLIVCAAMIAGAQPSAIIAYTHAPDGGPPIPVEDVCTIRADGSGSRCLTNDGHSHNASWSPDGKRILFIHDAALSGKPEYKETEESKSHHPVELSVMDADGRNRRVIRVIEPVIYSAAWSPDGATIAISAATLPKPDEPARAGLYLLPANGQGNLRLVASSAWTPCWSPDGTKLAFTVENPRGRWTVHTANVEGTKNARLTDPGVDSGSPAWSPDGKTIAFTQSTGIGGREQIFVMNADGSHLRQLTADTSWSCEHPAWMPAGDQLSLAAAQRRDRAVSYPQ